MQRGRKVCCPWFALSLVLIASASHAASSAPIVSGDLIVKFRAASDAGRLLAQAQDSDVIDPKLLAQVATRLSSDLKVPLAPIRVTSGQELVLAIERAQLEQSIKQQLTRRAGIRRVAMVPNAKSILPPAKIEFIVECNAPCTAQVSLVQLLAAISPQLRGHTEADGKIILRLDVTELTRTLVAQLLRRPDVLYAQANQIVRPLSHLKKLGQK